MKPVKILDAGIREIEVEGEFTKTLYATVKMANLFGKTKIKLMVKPLVPFSELLLNRCWKDEDGNDFGSTGYLDGMVFAYLMHKEINNSKEAKE